MNLTDFLVKMRQHVVEWAQNRPADYVWNQTSAWQAFDNGRTKMLMEDLPESIELDPES